MTVDHPDTGHAPLPMLPVEPGYAHVIRIQLALFWLPFAIGAVVLDRLILAERGFGGPLAVAVPLLALIAVVTLPQRAWARLGYRIHATMLQVVRGYLFHTDTLVPFVRVQHIDVTRGPLDKAFGTASLVVHTAGTHNSIVVLPGLSPTNAEAIRETIREHIRTDSE